MRVSVARAAWSLIRGMQISTSFSEEKEPGRRCGKKTLFI
jgi:hypothetical protein